MHGHVLRRRIAALSSLAIAALGAVTLTSAPAHADPDPTPKPIGTVVAWGGTGYFNYDYVNQHYTVSGGPVSLDGQDVAAVASGNYFSLALTSDGHVVGFGDDFQSRATAVPAGLRDATAVAAGADHSLALTADGTVTAWGSDDAGQIDVPEGLHGVTMISAGAQFSSAVTSDGVVHQWGDGVSGQTQVPAALDGQDVTALDSGPEHTLAVADGKVYAWGADHAGETQVPASLSDQTVVAVSAGGFHSLALTDTGHVVAWGDDTYGETEVPDALADHEVVDISAGLDHSVALTADGQVFAWGEDGSRQVSDQQYAPTSHYRAIDAGYHSTITVADSLADPQQDDAIVNGAPRIGRQLSVAATFEDRDNGNCYGCDAGSNRYQRYSWQWYADGTPIPGATKRFFTPQLAQAGTHLSAEMSLRRPGYLPTTTMSVPTGIVSGRKGGQIAVWGDNWNSTDIPAGLRTSRVTDVAVNDDGFFAAAATASGAAVSFSQGDSESSAPDAPGGEHYVAVSAGSSDQALALTDQGHVTQWTSWGADQSGDVPAPPAGQTYVDVAAGTNNLALTSAGEVVAWGDDQNHQNEVPILADGERFVAIGNGRYFSVAVTSTGELRVWGHSPVQSDSDPYGVTTPPALSEGETYTTAQVNYLTGMALTSTGRIVSWGYSGYVGSPPQAATEDPFTSFANTWFGGLALTASGRIVRWNGNDSSLFDDSVMDAPDVPMVALDAGYTGAIGIMEPHPFDSTTGEVAIAGDSSVGATLTSTSTVDTSPASVKSGQWLRDGEPIDGATDSSYTLTNDDAGHQVRYQVTATRTNWDDAVVTSDAIGPVEHGVITMSAPVVDGTPVVDRPVTAYLPDLDPWDAQVTYKWFRGEDKVGSGDTYYPTAADQGHALTVVAKAEKPYFDIASESTITDPVAGAEFSEVWGYADVGGAMTVGSTLDADWALETQPTLMSQTTQWLRDGEPIEGATDASYTLTNDDAGHEITFAVTGHRDGYADVSRTSDPQGAVVGGHIALPDPAISGDAVVGGELTAAEPEGVDPSDVTVDYTWYRGKQPVGYGATYSPTADDAGQVLTVEAIGWKDYFFTEYASSDTDPIANGRFAHGPAATISGTVQVGQLLTAGTGETAPEADSFDYQWFANGTPIAGATESSYRLTAAERHTHITVQVTAHHHGYDAASDTSAATADVATELAPGLDLGASSLQLRRGQSATLTWHSTDATGLSASGAWSGDKQAAGSATVAPTALGGTTYVLSASNANGTTTTQVTVQVRREAKTLPVTAPEGLQLRGNDIPVSASGLDPYESYTVTVGGVQVAAGQASSTGTVSGSVPLVRSIALGNQPVVVTGAEGDRTGSDTVRLVTERKLWFELGKRAKAGGVRSVTVHGLVPGEEVTLRYRGEVVSPDGAVADADGTYTLKIHVGHAGKAKVAARGQYAVRHGETTFTVGKAG